MAAELGWDEAERSAQIEQAMAMFVPGPKRQPSETEAAAEAMAESAVEAAVEAVAESA